jgi:hypothetical protein
MKLIDQTPYQNYKGEISFLQRLQGMLKYGFSWYAELQAQKNVLAAIERILQGFTVIRNHTLDESGIVLPLIVIGKFGIAVAYVTHLKGTYMAKEDSWRVLRGSNFQDTPINLLTRTERLARALTVFLERQGVKQSLKVDPVILAADPGLFVESQRPIVRVVLNDGLERWANGLVKAPPVISEMNVEELAERIIKPKRLKRKAALGSEPRPEGSGAQAGPASEPDEVVSYDDELEPSRAAAIFRAAEAAEALDPKELGFAFEDEEPVAKVSQEPGVPDLGFSRETNDFDLEAPDSSSGVKKRRFGMSPRQLMILGGIVLLEICILAGIAYMYLNYF